MAKPKNSNKKVKSGLLTLKDIAKGWTSMSQGQDIWTLAPVQAIPLEDKDEDWIKWNADWFENIALRELPKKAKRYDNLYLMAQGKINKNLYIDDPNHELKDQRDILQVTEETLLQQSYPLAPNIINVFLGEQLKRNNKIIVDATDPESVNEAFDYKMQNVSQILEQYAVQRKQIELMKMGILPSDGKEAEQEFNQQIQAAQELAKAETEFKNFRTTGAKWGQKFIEKYRIKHWLDETELWMYYDSLVVDEVVFALNLHDDDFFPEKLEPKKTYINIGNNKRYYSEANFVVHVDFMTIPDIINKFRGKLSDEQIESLEDQYGQKITRDILFDHQHGDSSSYYNTSKSMDWNMGTSPGVREAISDKTLQNFLFNPDEVVGSTTYGGLFTNEKYIRVSRIWWPSLRKIGLLTKVDPQTGERSVDNVDENFLVTEKPVYNKSLLNEETATTIVSGEHVDWKYVTEWRYVVKIGQNTPYWHIGNREGIDSIYLYGDPIRFQFKNSQNLYDAKPPIEGCRISSNNSVSVSMIDKIMPWQISYNVLNNKGLKIIVFDRGKILHANASDIQRNSLLQGAGNLDPLFSFLDSLQENKVLINNNSQDARQFGPTQQPFLIDLSEINEAAMYFQTAQFMKMQAFESIGVFGARVSQPTQDQSATGTQLAADASVNQTEIYFDLFNNKLMPRVYQMILDAGQYYTSMSEEFSDTYINSELDKVYFSVLRTDLLLRDFCVRAQSSVNMRKLMEDLKQLALQDNTMGATFLDKVNTFMASNPSELIESLKKAEDKRMKQQQQEYESQIQAQNQQQQMMAQMKDKEMQLKNTQYYDGLQNERVITEMKTQPQPVEPSPIDPLKQQQVQQQATQNASVNQNNDKKLELAEKQFKSKESLEKEKLAQKDREIASKDYIAAQNKNSADLKFIQAQKNKNKK